MLKPIFFLALAAALGAQDFSKLPDWAVAAAMAANLETPPADVDAWVLLDRTEIAYTGDNEIRQRKFRLVKVLEERGIQQGVYILRGLGGGASKVKKLKGWNLRPDKEMVKLDSDNVVAFNDASSSEFSTDTATGAVLQRVAKGSLVAFESLEVIQSPIGPVSGTSPMEASPIRRWELEVAKQEGWFSNLKAVAVNLERRHFDPLIPASQIAEVPGVSLKLSNVPALPKGEGALPHYSNILPTVRVRFLDPSQPQSRMWASWAEVGHWTLDNYRPKLSPAGLAELKGQAGLPGLRALWAWMGHSLIYKQVYLTPERGWVPEASAEVGRKRYGDCKDLSCFFLAEAAGLGFRGVPALARIGQGDLEMDGTPFPVFNHVIAALRLDATLGLPAEVMTPQGRFLLVDPTDTFTPFGQLGEAHRGGRVLICTEGEALWAAIPSSAILPARMEVGLEGEATLQGKLAATMTLRETGDVWGLRSTAHQKGDKGLRELLATWFDLPPTGSLEVKSKGDPFDSTIPFEVKVRIEDPLGVRNQAGERTMAGWGLPYPPAPIQKAGVPRQLPIRVRRSGELSFRAHVKMPGHVQPVAASRKENTAFRAFNWQAEAVPEGGDTLLTLTFDQTYKDADYPYEQRDKGLQDWKKDRSLLKSFREDALAFRVMP